MEKKNNYGKAAFILSIIADSFTDVGLLLVVYIYSLLNLNMRTPLHIFFGFSIIVGPIVMGIIALSMLRQAKGTKKVFIVLTKIFSIMAIVASALILLYYGLVVLMVGALVA